MGYTRYRVKDLADKDLECFVSHYNRIELLYDWIKQGKINVEQFRQLIDVDKEEQQYQIDLDSFD